MDRGITNASVTSRFTRVDWIFVLLLISLTLATRLPFRSEHLLLGDSVHFALGMERYNVSEYRPHPPGFFLFIAISKVFSVLVHDVNQSLVATAILLSVGAAVLLYLLSRDMFSRKVGIVASLLFLSLPLFWYYGEIAMTRTGIACFSIAIAFFSYRVYSQSKKKLWVYLGAGVLGISGGIRPDVFWYMLPLAAFSLYKSWPGKQVFLRALAILGVSVAIWYVPMVLLSNGITAYSRVATEQLRDYASMDSMLFGNSVFQHLRMLKDLALHSIVGNYFLSGYALVYLVVVGVAVRTTMRDQRFAFLLIWLLPFILSFAIVYFEPSYLLAVLPVVYIGFGYLMVELTRRFVPERKVKLALVVQLGIITSAHVYNFLGQPPQILVKAVGKPFAEKTWGEAAAGMIYDAFFRYTYGGIVGSDRATETYAGGIRSLSYQPDEVVVLHFQRSSWSLGVDYYYLPEYSIYDLEDYRDRVDKIRYGKNREFKYVLGKVIRLSPTVRCVAVICQRDSPTYRELAQEVTLKDVPLSGGHTLFLIEQPEISVRWRGFFFTNSLAGP